MENSQIFEVPLDSPIDYDSADMLSPANVPSLALNRQQYQGSVLPNSLRYEHDGYFAGEHAHEFNHVPGAKIKDNKNSEYAVKKHQAYYAPVYHITSGNVSFDYYPLTTVIQSNTDAIVTNKIGNLFDVTLNDKTVTVNKDTANITGSNITVKESVFDPQLFTFDLAIVDKDKSVDKHIAITKGEGVSIGYDTYLYTYEKGVHKWGDQFSYDSTFTSADGTIRSLSVSDSAIDFDYSLMLETTETLQIVTEIVAYNFAYNTVSINTNLDIAAYQAIATSNNMSVSIPTWYSISKTTSGNSTTVEYTADVPKFGDNGITPNLTEEHTLFMMHSIKKKAIQALFEYFSYTLSAYTFSHSISFPTISVIEEDSRAFKVPGVQYYSHVTDTAGSRWTDADTYYSIYKVVYNGAYCRFNTQYASDCVITFSTKNNESITITLRTARGTALYDMSRFTDFLPGNKMGIITDLDYIHTADYNHTAEYNSMFYDSHFSNDNTLDYLYSVDYTVESTDGIPLPEEINDVVRDILTNGTYNIKAFNCVMDEFDTAAVKNVRKFVTREPCLSIDIISNGNNVHNCICIPWTKYYAPDQKIMLIQNDNIASFTPVDTLQALNGRVVEQGSDMFCDSVITKNTASDLNLLVSIGYKATVMNVSSTSAYNGTIFGSNNNNRLISNMAIRGSDIFTASKLTVGNKTYNIAISCIGAYFLADGAYVYDAGVPYVKMSNKLSGYRDSIFTLYDASSKLTVVSSESSKYNEGIQVDTSAEYVDMYEYYQTFRMSEFIKSKMTTKILDALKTVSYNFIRWGCLLGIDIYNSSKLKYTTALNNKVYINQLQNVNSWIEYNIGNEYYMLDDSSYVVDSVHAKLLSNTYFALLFDTSVLIDFYASDNTILWNVQSDNMISVHEQSMKIDTINNTATLSLGLDGIIYNYKVEDKLYPTLPDEVPEYIKRGSLSYAYTSNDYYDFTFINGVDNIYMIDILYTIDPTYKITAATITPESEWQHGLSDAMLRTTVTFSDSTVSVKCAEDTMSYSLLFDQKTQEVSFKGIPSFVVNDIGNYTITKRKEHNTHITLQKAHISDNIAVINNVIDNKYNVEYNGTYITFDAELNMYSVDSPFSNYNIDNVSFAEDISFHLEGSELYTATVTVEDIYNLNGITREKINDRKITFNR